MGANLGYGNVIDEKLVCPFHQWAFAGDGRCVHIPHQDTIPASAHTFSYPTQEKYGFVWIFNGPEPTFPLPSFPHEEEVRWTLNCHHHIVVSNAIDLNHWRCVHGFEREEEPAVETLADFGIRVRLRLAPCRPRPLFRIVGLRRISASIAILGGNLAVITSSSPTAPSKTAAMRARCLFSFRAGDGCFAGWGWRLPLR